MAARTHLLLLLRSKRSSRQRHAHVLQRRREVRICTYEEAAAVERANLVIAARSGALPRLALDMPL